MPSKQDQMNKILDFCNHYKIRMTYSAVAEILEVNPQGVSHYLGTKSDRASWIVSKNSKLPTGYPKELKHKELLKNPFVIEDIQELRDVLRLPKG